MSFNTLSPRSCIFSAFFAWGRVGAGDGVGGFEVHRRKEMTSQGLGHQACGRGGYTQFSLAFPKR